MFTFCFAFLFIEIVIVLVVLPDYDYPWIFSYCLQTFKVKLKLPSQVIVHMFRYVPIVFMSFCDIIQQMSLYETTWFLELYEKLFQLGEFHWNKIYIFSVFHYWILMLEKLLMLCLPRCWFCAREGFRKFLSYFIGGDMSCWTFLKDK